MPNIKSKRHILFSREHTVPAMVLAISMTHGMVTIPVHVAVQPLIEATCIHTASLIVLGVLQTVD